MDTKRKRGRPKLPASDRRDKVLFVLVREDELDRVKQAADRAGMGIAAYVRYMLGLES